ncbi:MAG: hypothetical protein EBT18_06815 [Gammaproteobacteria bacterium]|nr:hypothetical protein [Gammaproteobacteria bacterium]
MNSVRSTISRSLMSLSLILATQLVYGAGGDLRQDIKAAADKKATEAASASSSTSGSGASPGAPAAPIAFSGVGVAVLDTGVSLRGSLTPAAIAPGSKSFVGGNPLSDRAKGAGHGTPIAQIIRSISPSSKILSIQTSTGKSGAYGSSAAVSLGMQYAAANPGIRVINHSNAALVRTPGPVIIQTALNDQVLVMQAGNQGRSSPIGDGRHAPGLGGNALIVGGLGPGGTIYVMSNQAGDLAQHYVVAAASSKFAKGIGTSFATPHVSGIAAKLRETWPDLSAQDVVSIIKRSAVDMGKPGVDGVYGWGRASPTRAFMPLGPVVSPSQPSSGSGNKPAPSKPTASYVTKRLQLGAPLHSAVLSNPSLFNAMVFDQYGRNFYFDLSKTISRVGAAPALKDILVKWNQTPHQTLIGDYLGYDVFSISQTESKTNALETEASPVLLMRSPEGAPIRTQLGFGIYPTSRQGAQAFLASNQYDAGPGVAWRQTNLGHYKSEGVHSLAAFEVLPSMIVEARYSDVSDSSGLDYGSNEIAVASHFSFGSAGVSLEGGWLQEEASLFGGVRGGPMSVDGSETRFVRVSAHRALGSRFALVGSLTGALTQVGSQPGTLLTNYSDLVSDGWVIGLHSKSILRARDAISLTIAQPLRVRSGEADLDIAYGFDSARQILRNQQRLNLEPSGSETLVELGYRTPWGKSWQIGGFLTFRSSPDHIGQSPTRTELMAVAQTRF